MRKKVVGSRIHGSAPFFIFFICFMAEMATESLNAPDAAASTMEPVTPTVTDTTAPNETTDASAASAKPPKDAKPAGGVIYPTKPRDRVWAKVKGYPWWPGFVVAHEHCPLFLMKQMVRGAMSVPVLFCGTRDYAWVNPMEIRPYEPFKSENSKGTKTAKFKLALKEIEQPELFEEYFQDFANKDESQQPWVVGEEETAKEEVKPGANKRKSGAHDVASNKKMKRESTGGKLARRSSTISAKSSAASRSASEQLLSLRHRMQKIFLGDALRTEEFDRVDEVMTKIEQFPMTFDLLKDTKIGKVIKRISLMKMENEPANVVKRSTELLEAWRKLLPIPSVTAESEEQDNVAPKVEVDASEKTAAEDEGLGLSALSAASVAHAQVEQIVADVLEKATEETAEAVVEQQNSATPMEVDSLTSTMATEEAMAEEQSKDAIVLKGESEAKALAHEAQEEMAAEVPMSITEIA